MPVRDIHVQDRGSFFDDVFFRESWDDFDTAMQKVLDRFGGQGGAREDSKSRPECRDVYRQIRSNKIDDDIYASQAIQVTEKDGRFQVVMDVRDFNPTDLQVKVVDEKVVLEGRYDKVSEDGKSSSSKAFYREFMLPPEADIDQISTALSKDGVLTIRSPRKEGTMPSITQQKNIANASQFLQSTLNDHRYGNKGNQNTNYESNEAYDSLPRDVKDRLNLSDRDSGHFSSASASPIPSGFSNTPSCASPAPSEAGSETSRVSSTMEFDTGKRNPYQRSEVSFKVGAAPGFPGAPGTPGGGFQAPQPQMNVSNVQPSRSCTAVGSGGTASISVKEEDGKRTLTSEKSSLVQQKDGFLESKEVAAEVTEKDSQAARREAVTRMMKTDEDPDGKFKKSEAADASDISETCVKTLPDGSVVTVKKSSTSTSNVKQSFSSSTGGPGQLGFFEKDFPTGFGDMPNLMGRGQSLMSEMSSDSLASNMSNFSDMSNMSNRFSDMSSFSGMNTAGLPNRDPFQDRFSNVSNDRFSNMSSFSNFPNMGSNMSQQMNFPGEMSDQSNVKRSFSSNKSTHSTSSTFDNTRKF